MYWHHSLTPFKLAEKLKWEDWGGEGAQISPVGIRDGGGGAHRSGGAAVSQRGAALLGAEVRLRGAPGGGIHIRVKRHGHEGGGGLPDGPCDPPAEQCDGGEEDADCATFFHWSSLGDWHGVTIEKRGIPK